MVFDKIKTVFFGILIFTVCVFAQQLVSITGKVTNSSGQGLEAVTVKLLSGSLACTTKTDGSYSLSGVTSKILGNRLGQLKKHIEYHNQALMVQTQLPAMANFKIYDRRGRLLASLFDGQLNTGTNKIPFVIERFGKGILLLQAKIGEATSTYMINTYTKKVYPNDAALNLKMPLSKVAGIDWLQATKSGYASSVQEVSSYNGVYNITMSTLTAPNFGLNVHIFDPSMPMATIQTKMDNLLSTTSQFSTQRSAYFFKPGQYNLKVTVGFYIHAMGLGMSPDDVSITGAIESRGQGSLVYFWRSAENFSVTPSTLPNVWAVSQAAPFRRMHIKGTMSLSDGGSTSGGYMSDCKIDGTITSGSQQQWYMRNSQITGWNGGNWNMFFQGIVNPPKENWPTGPITVIPQTPLVREKPFLTIDASGNYSVFVPALRENAVGTTWINATPAGESIPIDQFYIAIAGTDNAASINAALAQGKNLLLTPGIYNLDAPIEVNRPSTVVLGIGFPSLVSQNGNIAMKLADVDGIKLAGILFDAGATESPTQLQVGEPGSSKNHSANPVCLFDIFCRIGGYILGKVATSVTINSNNVILDHCWVWRADHGAGVGWTSNTSKNGMIVNGNDVIVYGQFMEHHQQYQTVWNGNNGRNYFFQNEIPYEVPSQADFMNGTVNGWASYKVGNSVVNHEAWGTGVYAFFNKAPILMDNGIEAPTGPGIKFHHIIIQSLGGNKGEVTHVINGTGVATNNTHPKTVIDEYP